MNNCNETNSKEYKVYLVPEKLLTNHKTTKMNLTELTETETFLIATIYLTAKKHNTPFPEHKYTEFLEEMYNRNLDVTENELNFPNYLIAHRDVQFDILEQNDLHNRK